MKSGYDQFFTKAKKNAIKSDNFRPEQRKNKKAFPVFPFAMFGICILAVFVLIEKFDNIESYISKIEIGLGTAQAEETNPAEVKPAEEAPKIAEAPVAPVKEDNADYLFKLAERKKELDTREQELNRKSAEIEKQKIEIESKLKQLEDSREKITVMLKERIATDAKKVDNLVQVYSNMKPSQAAKVFETLDEDLVIEILGNMKKKNAADILNLIKTEKAQMFSERYAGYRKPAQVPEAPVAAPETNKEETKPTKP